MLGGAWAAPGTSGLYLGIALAVSLGCNVPKNSNYCLGAHRLPRAGYYGVLLSQVGLGAHRLPRAHPRMV